MISLRSLVFLFLPRKRLDTVVIVAVAANTQGGCLKADTVAGTCTITRLCHQGKRGGGSYIVADISRLARLEGLSQVEITAGTPTGVLTKKQKKNFETRGNEADNHFTRT